MAVIGVVATAAGIAIALSIHWFPADASTQAHNIRTLYDVLLIASVPIFVLVITVVGYSVWNFRMKPGEEEKDGPPIHGNTRLEVVWTALTALLIVGLCAYSYSVLRSNEDNKPGAMVVNVTARQFAFEFSYPNAKGQEVLSPELSLPVNKPIVFHLRSLDVIHSFFVPQFSEKLDAVPGIVTTLRVTPLGPGITRWSARSCAARAMGSCAPGRSSSASRRSTPGWPHRSPMGRLLSAFRRRTRRSRACRVRLLRTKIRRRPRSEPRFSAATRFVGRSADGPFG